MKLLLVHPGADWSVSDVWRGLSAAFERAGVELIHYAMSGRIEQSAAFLDGVNKANKRKDKDAPEFGPADYMYHASTGVIERALRHKVDWVFYISGLYFHVQVYELMRRAGIRQAVLLTESPYNDDHEKMVAGLVDVVFTNERSSVETFKPLCHSVHYYQHAYDPDIHNTEPLEETEDPVPAHDVVFVGTGFEERIAIFHGIDWEGIDFGLYGTWKLLGSRNRLREHLKLGVVPNEYTAQLYRRAKIGLNPHRTSLGYGRDVEHVRGAESMNPRCYELAATGTFFITDPRPEVKEVFGSTVPTAASPEEWEEQIRYWLAHDEERAQVAAQLPGLVRDHTFDARAADILRILVRFR